MRAFYLIWMGCALLGAPASAQTPAAAQEPTEYLVFVQGVPLGREDVVVRSDADGTVIVMQGRTAAPVNSVLRRVEFRYGPDGSPQGFVLEGTMDGTDIDLRTAFENGTATSTGSRGGDPISVTQQVSPAALMIPNGIFGGFAALAARLSTAAPGDQFRLFLLPSSEIQARLEAVRPERIRTGSSTIEVRRYDLLLEDPSGTLVVSVTTDAQASLLRVSVPQRSIEVLRSDIATVSSRVEVHSNPGDQPVTIPAAGFNLAATLTVPGDGAALTNKSRALPAVVLVPGQTAPDRDTLVRGVPVMAQLAGSFAQAGFLVVRYDRRGTGQSGGRAESSTLSNYADDVRTVVRWLGSRQDVDRNRIAVVAHGESAWPAMLAASRERRISAVVTLAAPSSIGSEMVLEQQQRQIENTLTTDAERAEQIALQKRVHDAVLSGRGWDKIPADLRQRADTPWFESLLKFDPAKVIDDVDGDILIVHGDADRTFAVAHAERLAEFARNGDAESVELLIARGGTHFLTSANTGDDPAAALATRMVDPDVATAVRDWLTRTLPAPQPRR